VSAGQAQAEMNSIQEHIDEIHPDTERGLNASGSEAAGAVRPKKNVRESKKHGFFSKLLV